MHYPVVSMKGEGCLPRHVILPFSRSAEFHEGLEQLRQKHKQLIAEHGIIIPAMFSTVATNAFLYEPVIYWPDNANDFHKEHTTDALLENMRAEANPEARKAVEVIRADIVDLIHTCGGGHLQIGKTYPYLRDRSPEQVAMLQQLKTQIDPNGLINPGALGLGG